MGYKQCEEQSRTAQHAVQGMTQIWLQQLYFVPSTRGKCHSCCPTGNSVITVVEVRVFNSPTAPQTRSSD